MICYLRGKLVEKHPAHMIIDVGGVGYKVFISIVTYEKLPSVGEDCLILTHYFVREDRQEMFGFAQEEERRMFLMLLNISGIGPKLALGTLSGLSVRELKAAIVEGNVKRLTTVSGLGKKTAERMVLEMRHKFDEADGLEAIMPEGAGTDSRIADAVMALISLGYRQDEARRKIMKVWDNEKEMSVEQLIKKALAS